MPKRTEIPLAVLADLLRISPERLRAEIDSGRTRGLKRVGENVRIFRSASKSLGKLRLAARRQDD
ncbi:MAG: hypothetical protein OXU20_32045 [Myxococcales bacterium]|nr:hypothetical protein [Myxococcales bacterium]